MVTAVELVLLAMVAVVAGWGAAFLSIRIVVTWLAGDVLPRSQEIDVFSSPVVLVGIAAPVFVVLPALLSMRRIMDVEPATWLSRYSVLQCTSNWFKLLPVISIALTMASLATSVSFSVSSLRMNAIDLGFVAEDVGALSLVRRQPPEELDLFLTNAMDAINALPGVIDTSAILAGSPASPNFLRSTVEAREHGESVRTTIQFASAGYHEFLGVPVLSGRDIEETDIAGTPLVAIINETLSRMLFRGLDPIGEIITLSGMAYEVVGIAADRKNAGLRAPAEPELVMSIHQWAAPGTTVLIKFDELRPTWATEAVGAIRQVDPLQSISGFSTLEETLNANRRTMTFFTGTIWVFSVLTLFLGILGINAIVAAAQSKSVRETGVRMALGEGRLRSAVRVLGIGLRRAVIGAIIGAVIAVPVIGVFDSRKR
jgi:putative ABC transport system permease protein